MTHKGFFLATYFALSLGSLPALAAAEKGLPMERIEKGCHATIVGEYKPAKVKATCACVRANYEAKDLKAEELELMVRSYEEDAGAEEELQDDKWNTLILFDHDVTEGCLEKSSYRFP
ncbi:MAG: hypothetical protein EOP11_24320 [Proteobacteria bacterium]|nr:MAG: hypothetical protein EOP11_24320 [Pseudomonadota bacterium]